MNEKMSKLVFKNPYSSIENLKIKNRQISIRKNQYDRWIIHLGKKKVIGDKFGYSEKYIAEMALEEYKKERRKKKEKALN